MCILYYNNVQFSVYFPMFILLLLICICFNENAPARPPRFSSIILQLAENLINCVLLMQFKVSSRLKFC